MMKIKYQNQQKWQFVPCKLKEFIRLLPLLYCDHKYEQLYKNSFPEFSFVKWHEYAYDILPQGASKAVGILKLLETLGINNTNCFAFGDGLNDLEMLATVGTGIAMGNAVPEAKAAADIITTSSSDNGISNGLKMVGLL